MDEYGNVQHNIEHYSTCCSKYGCQQHYTWVGINPPSIPPPLPPSSPLPPSTPPSPPSPPSTPPVPLPRRNTAQWNMATYIAIAISGILLCGFCALVVRKLRKKKQPADGPPSADSYSRGTSQIDPDGRDGTAKVNIRWLPSLIDMQVPLMSESAYGRIVSTENVYTQGRTCNDEEESEDL